MNIQMEQQQNDPNPTYWSYVLGFMFDETLERVVLIRKLRPEWQKGNLNGVGGSIKPGETMLGAMIREFREETGVCTVGRDWTHFATLGGDSANGDRFTVACLSSQSSIGVDSVRSITDEKVEVCLVGRLQLTTRLVENALWLTTLALENHRHGLTTYVDATHRGS
jgi:8-oxo-dGTP diphosphatase